MEQFNKDKFKDKVKGSGYKTNWIAEQIGLHRVTMSYYFSGNLNPKRETLRKIAKLIRCRIGDFYDKREC